MITQPESLVAHLNGDLIALRAAVPALWDTEANPDAVAEAERLSKALVGGVTPANLTQVGAFLDLMAAQDHLDADLRQRAAGAAFLASFCLTNADVVADEMVGA